MTEAQYKYHVYAGISTGTEGYVDLADRIRKEKV